MVLTNNIHKATNLILEMDNDNEYSKKGFNYNLSPRAYNF